MDFKCEIKGNRITIVTNSTLSDLCAAITMITTEIYNNLRETEKDDFKFAIKKGFEDDIPFTDSKER